ncbi:hypothetical protein HPB52_025119 [Rhipicephalus sanguineus]|uniref:RING-type domain-containing protein n=1 Tax=Rhipicephalus sanguineus TaxID=34632 RepID=A0A9D4SMB3_RHISA|nr:hypothetical protein HPB52_025119 [Rhipicephalus sanguineus]
MARRRSPSSGSFPELSLEDYDPMPYEELICAICHSVLRDPVECPCHHVFCRRCIWEWVHKDNSCPICRKRGISAVTPVPPFVRNMLNSLKKPHPRCDDWRRKAADGNRSPNRLRDTLRRLGDYGSGSGEQHSVT